MGDMGALKNLWNSERGLVAIALIAAVTVLCGMQQVTVEQWLDYSKWIFVTYAAAKTVTGAAALIPRKEAAPPLPVADIMTALYSIAQAGKTSPAESTPELPKEQ